MKRALKQLNSRRFQNFSMIWAVSFLFCQCWFLLQEKGMVHFAVFSMKIYGNCKRWRSIF